MSDAGCAVPSVGMWILGGARSGSEKPASDAPCSGPDPRNATRLVEIRDNLIAGSSSPNAKGRRRSPV